MHRGVVLVLLLAALAGRAGAQATLYEGRNLEGAWELPLQQSTSINCDDATYTELDDGLSSFKASSGELRVYQLGYFVGLMYQFALPPGLGVGMVNLSPNLENKASSWTWTLAPPTVVLPPTFISRRMLKYYWYDAGEDISSEEDSDGKSEDISSEEDSDGKSEDISSEEDSDGSSGSEAPSESEKESESESESSSDPSETDSSESDEYEGPLSPVSSEAEAQQVGCFAGGDEYSVDGPSDGLPTPAASVTFFEDAGSTYGDWSDRGESNNFCGSFTGAVPLAGKVSAAFVCGAAVTAFDADENVLFSVKAEEGHCVDFNLDGVTEDRLVTFDFSDSSKAQRLAPYRVYGGGALGSMMSGSSTLFVAPAFGSCHTPYAGPGFPESGPDEDEEDITGELGDDGFVEASLGFGFGFFGTVYDRVHIGSNGFLSFGKGLSGYDGAYMDSTGVPRIAAAQADLNPGAKAEDVLAGSACVAKIAFRAVKPMGPESDWSEKLDSLDECFEECRPEDGFTMIDHNRQTGACYCWKGEEGDDWQFELHYLGDAYDISECAPRVTYTKQDDRFAVTFSNVPFYGSAEKVSFQVLLLGDGSVRMTHGSLGVPPEGQSVFVGLFSGSTEDSVVRELSQSAPCGACTLGLSCGEDVDVSSARRR